MVISNLRRRRD